MSGMRLLLLPLVVISACGGSSTVGRPDGGGGDGAGSSTFVTCRGRAATPAPGQDWRHLTTSVVVATGAANHSAQDVIAHPGAAASLPGKFSYGVVSKDLEDEDVRVTLDDCSGWRDLGVAATSGDGRIAVSAPATLGPGVYEVHFQVLGDGSTTTSYLWIPARPAPTSW